MKKLNLFLFTAFIVLMFSYQIKAQQDYEIVQNFKAKYHQLEDSIKTANSLTKLDTLQSEIDALRTEYQAHEELLNKSLYPNDFNSSMNNLENALNVRRGDYTQITSLQTQVSGFKIQIDSLNKKNVDLFNQIQTLQEETAANKITISKLKKSVDALMFSLHRRDRLVMTMLDSLLPPSVREHGKLTQNEKQNLYAKEKKNDVLKNVETAIDDNIKFLEMTNLTPGDLSSIKKQEEDFQKLWQGVGPEIVDVYTSRKKSAGELQNIEMKFARWNSAITQEAWNSIRHNFASYGINLSRFSDGQGFIATLNSYINDQIQSANLNKDQAEDTFKAFTDSVWLKTVKPDWIPYLTENKMLSDTSVKSVDAKIAQWKSIVEPGGFNWLYIIVAVLIILIVILLVRSGSSMKKSKNDTV